MIVGIGTDIVQITRVRRVWERQGLPFAERILRPAELAQLRERSHPAPFLAKRFAAKEAAAKALGTGIGQVSFQDLEIHNDHLGAPHLQLLGNAATRLAALGGSRAHLTMSDERDYVVAFVVLSA